MATERLITFLQIQKLPYNSGMDELNVPFLFGLESQGHIPKIQEMLAAGKGWPEIGQAIGWCHQTARDHYEAYLRRNRPSVVNIEQVCSLLARAVEMLRAELPNKKHSWERNNIHSLIHLAEIHLLSTPAKFTKSKPVV